MAVAKKKPPADPFGDDSGTGIAELLQSLPGAQRVTWLEDNWHKMSANQRALVVDSYRTNFFGFLGDSKAEGQFKTFLDQHKDDTSGGSASYADWLDVAKRRYNDNQAGVAEFNPDLDGDGKVESFETDAVNQVKAEAITAAKDKGLSQAGAEKAVDQTFGVGAGSRPPDWVLQKFGGVLPVDAGGKPNPSIQQLMVEYQKLHPGEPVQTLETLWQKLQNPSPDNVALVEGAIYGLDPLVTHTYNLDGTNKFTVSQQQFEAAQKYWGLDSGTLGILGRVANTTALKDQITGAYAWQPLALLVNYAKNHQGAPGGAVKTGPVNADYNRPTDPSAVVKTGPVNADYERPGGFSIAGSATQFAVLFKEGMKRYAGDDFLAFLYAGGNGHTADNLYSAPKGRFTAEDRSNALRIAGEAGWDSATLKAAGFTSTSAYWDAIQNVTNAGGGLGQAIAESYANSDSTPPINQADPELVRQKVKDLWRELFLTDPSEGDIGRIVSQINQTSADRQKAAKISGVDVNTEINAQVQAAAEHSPLYDTYYGNKPGGMTDTAYRSQFQAGAATLLGNEAPDPSLIQAGLKTGDYQTTVGQTAQSPQAWGNSTFLGRLARAAAIVNANT